MVAAEANDVEMKDQEATTKSEVTGAEAEVKKDPDLLTIEGISRIL